MLQGGVDVLGIRFRQAYGYVTSLSNWTKGGCMLQRWCNVVAQNLLKAIHAPF